MLVTVITPSNVSVFPEYIIPNIKHLVQDAEVSVRCTYAQCIVQLADTAVRYLEMGQALKAHGALRLSAEAHEYENAIFEVSALLHYLFNDVSSLHVPFRSPMTQVCRSCKIIFKSIYLRCLWTPPASLSEQSFTTFRLCAFFLEGRKPTTCC